MKSSPIIIASSQNASIKRTRKLALRKYREKYRQFLVEGLQLIWMALEAGHQPAEVFYCPGQIEAESTWRLLDRLERLGISNLAISEKVMGTLAERETPQGILATFPIFSSNLRTIKEDGGLIIILDRLQDPGNLGTLIRTADAVGALAMILIEPCVDRFDPKAIRGTMGSIFNVPIINATSVPDTMSHLKNCGYRLVGADAKQGKEWGDAELTGSVALLLGNEARGLSDDLRLECQTFVRLPIAGKAESLNVAIAGGVLMYFWLRQNRRRI